MVSKELEARHFSGVSVHYSRYTVERENFWKGSGYEVNDYREPVLSEEMAVEKQQAEIEWLKNELEQAKIEISKHFDYIDEAIKEFVEDVKNLIIKNTYPTFDKEGKPISAWNADGYKIIDKLVKEMTEEQENAD